MRAAQIAYVTLTQAFATVVRCPDCGHWLMSVPGRVRIEVRRLMKEGAWSGRGRMVTCRWCKHKREVIEHG